MEQSTTETFNPSLSTIISNEPQASTRIPNQDVYLAKIDNTITAIGEQNLINDSRYTCLNLLKNRITENNINPAIGDNLHEVSKTEVKKEPLTPSQLNRLKAQITAYKILARNEPVTKNLLKQVSDKKIDDNLPLPYEYPVDLGNGEKLPYDLTKILSIHQYRANSRITTLPTPPGIDPKLILKERENRIQNRIGYRIKKISEIPLNINSNLRMNAELEMRALRLLNFQTQLRNEVMGYLKRDTTLETALNPFAYRRTKRHTLREARITEKLEKQHKLEQERVRKQKHNDLLQTIMQANKEFKEFHRNVLIKQSKIRKAVNTYHANSEKERKKDEARNEKMRMMKLMEEDDVGYRQLLDEKKDKRLVFLLQQTDEYVESLTGLVKQHQATEKKRKKDEKKEAKLKSDNNEDVQVAVRNSITGEILKGDVIPGIDEIEAWLEKNPNFELISRENASDSEDEKSEEEIEKPIPVVIEEKEDEYEGLDEEQRNRRIIEKARNEEDEYDQKTKAQMESYYATAHKIREKVVKQHYSLGGGDPSLQLKPYQIKGLEWMVSLYNNNLNGILADEMGLGKTIQTVALVTYLMEVKKVNGPYLIIVPLSTVSNWNLELEKWAPHVIKIVFKGDKDARKKMESAVKKGAFNVLLTTYDYVLKEKGLLGKIRWKYMIIDEGHRMKNHNCKLTLTLNAYFLAQHRLLLTGTPLQNKLPELWALLNFLLPSIFSSCGTFEQWFNAPFATTGEKVELNQEETMLIIRRLHKVLRPFLLRRLKKEVESQLPSKTEYVIKCDMSSLQRIIYKHLQKGLLIDSKHQAGRALMNTIVHLRKLCNHPFLFQTVEDECLKHWKIREVTGQDLYRVSGKFELLDRILPKLKKTNHRVLIFCQMTQLMNIMEDYFNYREWKYMRLDGSTKHEDRGNLLKEFNAPNSQFFIFMLSTRAGGLGLNLQTADTVIIFDSDWNPHQDMQAQDRAHRIGQTREVLVLRLITSNSVEEKILAAARYKLNVDEKVIQAGKFDQSSTGAERRQMLERIIREENDNNDENDAFDDDDINQIISRSDEEHEIFRSMDIERRRREASEYNRKPRLIEESEIPTTIIAQSKKFTEDEEKLQLQLQEGGGKMPAPNLSMTNSGRRKRKDVNYSADLMSDKEWLQTMDDNYDDDVLFADEMEEPQKKKIKPEKGSIEGNNKRGRKKKKIVEDGEESDEDERLKRGVNKALNDQFTNLIQALINYKTSNGRELAFPFIQLPSRRELPEYYDVIDRPMDLNRIKKKIRESRYSSLNEVTDDINLLCENAQKYNIEASDIYEDSVLLRAVWKRLVETVSTSFTNLATTSTASTCSSASNTPTTLPESNDFSSAQAETVDRIVKDTIQ